MLTLCYNELDIIKTPRASFCKGTSYCVCCSNKQVLLFGAIGIVLVTATTVVVGREWHFPREEEQVPTWPPNLNEFIEDDEDKEEERSESSQENLNVLHLLYTIAQVLIPRGRGTYVQDRSHQEGFIHRGISCNKCHEEPIRGVRYHCLNCIDYDLCEYCEAEDAHFRLENG